MENYNRVLILPDVEPSDMGEYVCRAENTRVAIENTIALSIQGKEKINNVVALVTYL